MTVFIIFLQNKHMNFSSVTARNMTGLIYREECLAQSSSVARRRSRRWRCWRPAALFRLVPGVPASAGWRWHSLGGWWSWPVPEHQETPGALQGSGSGCSSVPRGLSSGHSSVRSSQICTDHSHALQSSLQHTEQVKHVNTWCCWWCSRLNIGHYTAKCTCTLK